MGSPGNRHCANCIGALSMAASGLAACAHAQKPFPYALRHSITLPQQLKTNRLFDCCCCCTVLMMSRHVLAGSMHVELCAGE